MLHYKDDAGIELYVLVILSIVNGVMSPGILDQYRCLSIFKSRLT